MALTLLASNLARAMQRTGYNDHSLAAASGLKPDVIRDIMRGRSKQPSAARLDAIARVLGCTPGQLLGADPWPYNGSDMESQSTNRPCDLYHDLPELRLITLWRSLDGNKRQLVMTQIMSMFEQPKNI